MSQNSGREEFLYKILIWLAIYSAIIGIFNLAFAGDLTLESMGSTGKIPGQVEIPSYGSAGTYYETANTAGGPVITNLDFTTATEINKNVSTPLGDWVLTSGRGLVLSSLPYFGLWPNINPSVVLGRNVQSAGGIYTFTTQIDNSQAGGSFYVYPRYISGYSGSDLKLVFASDGIHLKKFPLYLGILDNGDDYYYPYGNAQNAYEITTALTETVSGSNSNVPDMTSQLTVTKDGVILFSTPVRSILPGNNINDQVRHGGVGSDTVGFAVQGFSGTSLLDNSSSLVSGTNQGALDPLAAVAGVLQLFSTVLGLTQDPLVPFWLWAIIGLPCIGVVSFIYLEVWRGV